jgi:hypothetical protein
VEWNPSDSTQYQTYSNSSLSLCEISSNSIRSSRKIKSKAAVNLSCLEWSSSRRESPLLAYGNTTGSVFTYNWSTEEEVSDKELRYSITSSTSLKPVHHYYHLPRLALI